MLFRTPQVGTELENKETGAEKGSVDELEIIGGEQQSSQQACSKQLLHEETRTCQSGQPTRVFSSNTGKHNKGTKRRLDELSQAINELRTMNQILTQPEPCLQENEAFGKYDTSAINKLSQSQTILAQSEIQNILTTYRLNISAPPRTYTSPTPSNNVLQCYLSTSVPSSSPSHSNISSSYPKEQVTEGVLISNIISEAWEATKN